jgi:peptidoglycan/xylan/chitin deacetylase (PgdA/CDA1 family)
MQKREALASALNASRLFLLTKALTGSRLTIFNYHRIAKGDPALEPFDSDVFGPDEEGFRRELLQMKQHADPVSESELIASLNGGPRLSRNSFMVTFDDGYRDCFDRALPILKELRIPAVYFIPTEAIEERKLGWWDHIAWYMKCSKADKATATVLLQKMKLFPASDTATMLEELSRATGVAPPPHEACDRQLMTWEQIREAQSAGITIGSHTHTHRVLATLDLKTQKEELTRSKRLLEEKIGKPVRSVSYPVGGYEHFNIETKSLAREAGYEIAYSFLTGVNSVDAIDRFDVRRMCPQGTLALFAGVFCLPALFAKPLCALTAPEPCAHR